ncbi:alpha/beta fold hydrolase [Nesterenkonia alkaliphila]|uniref:Alpha/beta fold hydrolase n=1 Tax=Nesterenkonia alkaliphila TaxID=1463631 RepID=A0A7K1UHR7_9MICC|nr:alpha/beta fold hydrolase [Nesterenkonia alkaliphila]MVT26015.1 alpha/beta fold hydrolase [Nesterenkonia alkaliphila]GFZ86093.1 homoserine O-acetyltransferase [Nesterenkonia alkaliphila]
MSLDQASTALPALESFQPGDFRLVSGRPLPGAQLSYRRYGQLNPAGDNCVVLFSYYTGTDRSYAPWFGPGQALDPSRHCILAVNHFGGGVSSSPSNTAAEFPPVQIADTVRAVRQLLEHLGVQRLRLAAGWSLGGMQSLEFAIRYPREVEAVFACCSAARCAETNQVFLDGLAAALHADPRFANGPHGEPPEVGLDAFGRVYAGWAYSEEFYATGIYRELGYRDPAEVVASWGRDHLEHNAHDLMTSLRMWRTADLGAQRGGLRPALSSITARTVLMPSTTDTYFTLRESRAEARYLVAGELRELRSPLGHVAGRPGIRPQEQSQVESCLQSLLATTNPT